ncbi:hypothetical protein ABZ912_23790 [Nonomuraea angiospora]|uniref:hypothetical protein n=1 Tax=Nonomuraea angiospora TaxID=46172 RepID=UPI0033FD9C1C
MPSRAGTISSSGCLGAFAGNGDATFSTASQPVAAAAQGRTDVEGIALAATGANRLPVPHAWVCSASRHTALDVTWPSGRGAAYLGLRLSSAARADRDPWDSSPLLEVHVEPGLLLSGLPDGWREEPAIPEL